MPFGEQDIIKGFDFTGLVSASASQHNQLVDMAVLAGDKGLNLWSVDTSLNVPDVPNPEATLAFNKFKRYTWLRISFSGLTKPILYAWDNNAVSVATYLKWKDTAPDLAAIESDLATVTATANTAVTTANTATATANAANTLANDANNNAEAAQNDASGALVVAGNAKSIADTANTNATNANTTASSALAVASANKNLKYVKVSEQYVHGTNAPASSAGVNQRILNIEDSDVGGLASLAGGKVTLNTGTYKVRISCVSFNITRSQAYLIKDSDASVLLVGMSLTGFAGVIEINGLITLADPTTVLRVDHYVPVPNGTNTDLGRAATAGINANEVYVTAEFEKLD